MRLAISSLLLFFCTSVIGQQISIGAKGGLTVGTQQNRRALPSYHGLLFFETSNAGKDMGNGILNSLGLFTQLGYHRKGSSLAFISYTGILVEDVFHNLSLTVGGKSYYNMDPFTFYFGLGARLDVTAGVDLNTQYLSNQVRPVNAGLWIGGGAEWTIPKFPMGLVLEVSLNPDLTPQIFVPPGTQRQYYDYSTNTWKTQAVPEERIINLTFEVSLGFKFNLSKQTN